MIKKKLIALAMAGTVGFTTLASPTLLAEATPSTISEFDELISELTSEQNEVSNELAIKFEEKFGEGFYNLKDEKYYLDLWKINEYIIKSTKVSNIINLNLCTSCNSKLFHSYRKDNKTDKRIGMIIQINKGE